MGPLTDRLQLTDYRRSVAELYAAVRADPDPQRAHAAWRDGRDGLFRTHPQSPLLPDDDLRRTGLPYWPYDPALRLELELRPADPASLALGTGADGTTTLERIGLVELPMDVAGTVAETGEPATLDVWWLAQYGGGLFLPLRDGTAGRSTYGAGRYLLDTAKGADLGGAGTHLVVDLNFAYHPSCRYDPAWVCPLAPAGNRIDAPIEAGERMPA
jgi:hypothetical protein